MPDLEAHRDAVVRPGRGDRLYDVQRRPIEDGVRTRVAQIDLDVGRGDAAAIPDVRVDVAARAALGDDLDLKIRLRIVEVVERVVVVRGLFSAAAGDRR